ncbi:MAG: hypothetical protein ACI9CV_000036 [Ilumatobacter sp.]
MTDDLTAPPEPTAVDKAIEVAAAFAGEFPGFGTAVELIRQIFGTPFERRHQEWVQVVYEIMVELRDRDVDIDDLAARPEFISALHDASRIALGEHLEKKLEMLEAILINADVRPRDSISDLWTLRCLRWVDELEPQHVELMRFGRAPMEWLAAAGIKSNFAGGSKRAILDLAGLPYPKEQLDLVLEDLEQLRLAQSLGGTMTRQGMESPWVTERGLRFLDWLTIV